MKDRETDAVRETAPGYAKESDLLTYDDYLRAPEGLRYELLEGELRMTPSPNAQHQTVLKRLGIILVEQLEKRGLGEVFLTPFDVVLSEHNVVQPDILFIAKDRLGIVCKANVQGAPDLVIEVLSESTESWDRVSKRRVYSKYGVREYWLVDPDATTIEVLSRVAGSLSTAGVYRAGETASSLAFPDLRVDVGSVFA